MAGNVYLNHGNHIASMYLYKCVITHSNVL